jgi:hypothetical protein
MRELGESQDMNLFFFCFAVVGLTKIIVDSYLFGPVRTLVGKYSSDWINYLFNCHQCMGFWVGMFVGWRLGANVLPWIKIFLDGCAGSFLCMGGRVARLSGSS